MKISLTKSKKSSRLTEASRDLNGASMRVYEAIFRDEKTVRIGGKEFKVGQTAREGLRFLSVSGYTFIEQNPKKTSVWGRLAREGHKILWVIQGDDYIAQVRDSVFHDFRK